MNLDLFKKLKKWRDEMAKKEMVDSFRIIPNRTIEDIAIMEPRTREELTNIKGIKDKKYYKYGKEILDIVKESQINNKIDDRHQFFAHNREPDCSSYESENNSEFKERIYSVSEFLDYLNEKLTAKEVRLSGEVTSIDEREKVVYFNLKDKKDESVINCLIFRYQYEISGVKLEIGNEIIANGYPEVYKPMGRMSFKTRLIEISGEGALKKAYDELKKKLEKEGLFTVERKKPLPELPETIGLITSSHGAAIGDFTTNLGNYGFKIKFINSSVEGKQAVFDLIDAVKRFKKMNNIDVLVIIRGGGSLESLQAFNNEALVREVVDLKIPVVCGVGHEKDISLVSFASDLAVSTPTAAARVICESWDKAVEKLSRNESAIVNSFEKYIYEFKHKIEKLSFNLSSEFENIFQRFYNVKNNFLNIFENISFAIDNIKRAIDSFSSKILTNYSQKIVYVKNKIGFFENVINANNPERQLKLGYSIVSFCGKIVRSVKQAKKGDIIDIKVFDGDIESEVKKVKK